MYSLVFLGNSGTSNRSASFNSRTAFCKSLIGSRMDLSSSICWGDNVYKWNQKWWCTLKSMSAGTASLFAVTWLKQRREQWATHLDDTKTCKPYYTLCLCHCYTGTKLRLEPRPIYTQNARTGNRGTFELEMTGSQETIRTAISRRELDVITWAISLQELYIGLQ